MKKKIKINFNSQIIFIIINYAVTRAKAKLFRKYGIKDCYVSIERKLPVETTAWLQRPQKIMKRRGTVAGGKLFSVEGEILETGNDFLNRQKPNTSVNTTIVTRGLKTVQNLDSAVSVLAEPAPANIPGKIFI